MKTAKQILDEFWEMAQTRIAFDTKTGEHHEGYLYSVEESHIIWGEGCPLAPAEDLVFPIADIDLDTLWFWSETDLRYVNARWDEHKGEWLQTPRHH